MPIRTAAKSDYKPSYLAATIASLLTFVLYVVTLAPSTAMWDTSEYIAAAKVLGLPHPPGNPLFVLLGHFFGLLPIPVSYAQRISIMAALASAAAAGFWFLITERVLAKWLAQRWLRLTGASVAVLVGATSFTVWNQSVVNEKVYTISLIGLAAISWLMMCWCETPDDPRADRWLILVAFLMGLGYSNHPAGFLPLPAVGIAVLVRRPQTLLRWRLVLVAIAAIVLGLTPFAYEPIRAAYFPTINEGEPTGCTTHIEWSCTFSSLTVHRLEDNINRKQYQKPSVLDRQAPFSAQIGMYWLYFKWQWLRDAYEQHPGMQNGLAVLFLVLGLAGAWVHWKHDPDSFWYFAVFAFTLSIALVYYMNFKYSYSQAPQLGNSVPREPRDRDYFYLWSFSAFSVWVALGLAYLWESLATIASGAKTMAASVLPNRSWLITCPVLAIAFIPAFENWSDAPRTREVFTRDWAVDMLNSLEPYSVIVTNGDNDTFPLWYAQEVEGVRQDVIVAVATYLGTDWFVRQIMRRPIRPYDAAKGPARFRGRSWPMPSGPPLKMSFGQADSIPPMLALREPQIFQSGGITARIPAGYLTRDQLVTLQMIRDTYPQRPIFFSSAEYGAALGLEPYLLTQGLVTKLMPHPVTASPDTIHITPGYFDVKTTRELWDSVYLAPKGMVAQNKWVDRASVGVVYHYAIIASIVYQTMLQSGDTTDAKPIADAVEAMARAARLQPLGGEPARSGDQ
ncbi:MAG TPA: DUF2723 domain-containing protein [Gemmatimonadaceae bacterium]|nr:DUF2723 domain-containing protein [Gemmatimonadaceae bacterium]